jgi:hypothetical protein
MVQTFLPRPPRLYRFFHEICPVRSVKEGHSTGLILYCTHVIHVLFVDLEHDFYPFELLVTACTLRTRLCNRASINLIPETGGLGHQAHDDSYPGLSL